MWKIFDIFPLDPDKFCPVVVQNHQRLRFLKEILINNHKCSYTYQILTILNSKQHIFNVLHSLVKSFLCAQCTLIYIFVCIVLRVFNFYTPPVINF
jgi:hypothetical protein